MKQSIFQILKLVIVSLLIYSLLLLIHDTEGSKIAPFSPTKSLILMPLVLDEITHGPCWDRVNKLLS